MRGHKVARLDPLEISSVNLDSERPKDLNLTFFNLSKIQE